MLVRPVSGSRSGRRYSTTAPVTWPAFSVLQELLDGGLIDPGVFAEPGHALHLAVVHLPDPGPLGPGVGGGPLGGGLRHHFQGHQIGAALPQGGALAVVAGVAAADHQDVLAGGRDGLAVGEFRVQQAAGDAGQVVHREADTLRRPGREPPGHGPSWRRSTAPRRRSGPPARRHPPFCPRPCRSGTRRPRLLHDLDPALNHRLCPASCWGCRTSAGRRGGPPARRR